MKYKKLGSSDLEVGAAAAARASQPQAIVFVFGHLTCSCATRTKRLYLLKLLYGPKAHKQLQAPAAKALLPLAVLHYLQLHYDKYKQRSRASPATKHAIYCPRSSSCKWAAAYACR
jgi:hypothetical protein